MWSLDSYSQAETMALGMVLGKLAPAGTCIALHGNLGSGKTMLTKGIAKGMGITDAITSPTFTIVNQYFNGKCILNHMDIYRIDNEDELYELGIEEYFENDAICVIEWPEILGNMLPKNTVKIRFEKKMNEDGFEWRHIVITAEAEKHKWLEEAMSKYAHTIN